MSDVVVFTSTGAPLHLSTLTDVGDVQWSTGWGNGQPGGCQGASWTVDMDPNSTRPGLLQGRRVEIWDGPIRVYSGILSEPQRGTPWQFNATGLASAGGDYLCLDASGLTTSVPDTAIDQAIVRGLPWVRPTSISTTAFSTNSTTVDLNKLTSLVDAYAQSVSQRWAVFADGVLTLKADPTTPDWLLLPGAGVMGSADDEFANAIVGRYVSAADASGNPTAYASVTSTDSASIGRWGRREAAFDMTGLGLLTAPRAQSLNDARLKASSSRMGFTNGFDATSDNLVTPGGVPARLSQVRAGQMVRICGVLDLQGNLSLGTTVDVVIGQTTYTDGDDSIQINPVGLVPRSLSDVLAAPTRPADTFSG